MAFGLPAIGETSWGQKVLDSINAVKATADAALPSTTATSRHPAVTVATGPGIDPTGVSDSAAGLQAKIDGTPAGGWCLVPEGVYKLTTTLVINKTIRFGGLGAPRTGNDNSDPANVGVEFRYDGTSGDAILVQPANATNTRICPVLENFLVRGNRNVVGATAGGGINLSGRNLAQTAVNGFTIENVHVAEAKGNGLTFTDNVYEGRVIGLYATDCGGHGITASTAGGGVPGELMLADIHANDNLGDGLRVRGGGTWDLQRITSSRNAGSALDVDGCLLRLNGLQAESNTGATVVKLANMSQGSLLGVHVAYLSPSYTGTGVLVTGSSNVLIGSAFFSGTVTGFDIQAGATNAAVRVLGYKPSTGGKCSFSAGNGVADSFAGASVYASAGQTLNDGVLTAITFDTETHDTNAFHDPATNPSRFTVPQGMEGYYRLYGGVAWGSDSGVDKPRELHFYKGGASFSRMREFSGPTGDNLIHQSQSPPVYLAAGDYVELYAGHFTSGGTRTTIGGAGLTWFALERIGS